LLVVEICTAACIAFMQPFRKVRFFFLYAFVASGTTGLLIATLRTIALTQGIDQGQSFTDLAQNIGIDLAAIIGSALLIKRDIAAQDSRLTRMEVSKNSVMLHDICNVKHYTMQLLSLTCTANVSSICTL
jgi:Low psii accumulation1 / Rep27